MKNIFFKYARLLASTAIIVNAAPALLIAADGTVEFPATRTVSAISADGSTWVGFQGTPNGNRAFRLLLAIPPTATGTQLPVINGGVASFASSISDDGTVIVGRVALNGGGRRAVLWDNSFNVIDLGTLNGGNDSIAVAVSGDGRTVVGNAADPQFNQQMRAFRWRRATGMESLGTLNNGDASFATGVNFDGKVVVGYSNDGNENNNLRAFRWTEASNQMVSLGTLGGSTSRASGVSGDGKVVVGYSSFGPRDIFDRAFRWTEASNQMESLGTLNNGDNSRANAISSDGKVIVGRSEDGSANNADRAFRWIEAQGMRSLDSLLADSGVDLGGIHMSNANSTNRDGTIIVATGDNTRSYIVRLSLPQSQNATSAGVMDEENFQSSLSQAAATLTFGHRMSDLTLNGAHGKPMRSVLEDGQNSIWAGGDLARLLGDDYSGFRGLGEIGFGHGFGDGVSAQVSIGGFGEETSLDTGGEASGRMLYIVPEVGFDLRDNLRMTLTGLYGRGTLDTRRGYLNGANTDFSEGKSDVATVSARLRLDWVDAFTLQDTKITPFLSYAISRSEQSAYTETGGAFPAEWNAYSDNTHVVRTGLDATYDLDERTTLLGHIEASYGVSGDPPVTGKTIGLSSFSIDNANSGGFGTQAGIGAEYDTGHGVASFMVNGSLGANNPVAWVAASYRVRF